METDNFNGGDLKWRGKEILSLATEANIEAMETVVFLVEGAVKKYMSKAGTGRTYKKKRKSGKGYILHRASIAGQPPAPNWGHLRASMTGTAEVKGMHLKGFVGSDLEKLAAKVDAGTDLEYGYYLEMGTKNMQPRPFLRPTLRKLSDKILKIFQKANK